MMEQPPITLNELPLLGKLDAYAEGLPRPEGALIPVAQVCADAASTIRALREELAEAEKQLSWAQYTDPPERWVATRIELEGQDDVGFALAYPRSDGDPGFVVEVTLYKEDGDAEGTGTGSDLREAFAEAIRAAEAVRESEGGDA